MSDLTTETTEEQTTEEAQAEESKTPPWTAQLPDDYKDDPDFTGHAKLGDLAKNYKELKAKAEKSIEVPGENATDEEQAAFYNKLGRPEKAEDYEFKTSDIPDGLTLSDDLVQGFRGKAHSLGLNKGQAQVLFNWYMETSVGLYNAHKGTLKQESEKQTKALKEEWGNEYKPNMTLAERAAKKFGFEDFKGMSNADKKACLEIAKAVGEANLIIGDSRPGSAGGVDLNKRYPSMKDMKNRNSY